MSFHLYACTLNGVTAVVNAHGLDTLLAQARLAAEGDKPYDYDGPGWQHAVREIPSPPIATFVADPSQVIPGGHDGTHAQLELVARAGGHTLYAAQFRVPNAIGQRDQQPLTDAELASIFGQDALGAVHFASTGQR